jgi:DHA1 family tetracycline resistance protein-like MFS transporter
MSPVQELHVSNLSALSYPHLLRGRIGVIAVSVFLNFVGFTLVIPVMPFLLVGHTRHLAFAVGAIVSVYALCEFIAAPILGACSDRYGRRPVLLLSLLGSAVGYVLIGIGGSLWMIVAGRVIDGLTAGSISALFAYVADVVEPQQRSRVYGLLGAVGGLGFMLGPAIGGVLGEVSLSCPVFVAAALSLANLYWVHRAVAESLPHERRSARFHWRGLNPLTQLRSALTGKHLRILFAAAFGFCLAAAMWQSNLPVFLKQALGSGPLQIGLLLLVVGALDIIGQGVLAGWLLGRYGERRVAGAGLLLNALGCALTASVLMIPSWWWLALVVAAFTLGDGLFQPSIGGLIANAAPDDMQGSIQGANQSQQAVARMIGPLLAAGLFGWHPALPYAGGALALLAALAVLLGLRNRRA